MAAGNGGPAETGAPLVSVIIPVWNDAVRLRLCLAAVLNQTVSRELYEVIVVDNGSTDGSHEVASTHAEVVTLSEPRPGSYNARNIGLGVARGRYVAFTDSDCIPAEDWLERGLEVLQADDLIGVVAGRVQLFEEAPGGETSCVDYEQMFAFNQAANARRKASVTANWVSPRALLQAAGGFDGNLKSGGDFELARKIARRGKRVVYAPNCIVHHPTRGSLEQIASKMRRRTGGRWLRARGPSRVLWVAAMVALGWGERKYLLLRAPDLSLRRKLGVAWVSTRLAWVQQREIMRLMAGGQPLR